MIASRHYGHLVVLNHGSELPSTDYKAQLENYKYNKPYLFGSIPTSTLVAFFHDKSLKGFDRVFSHDIPAKAPARPGSRGKK